MFVCLVQTIPRELLKCFVVKYYYPFHRLRKEVGVGYEYVEGISSDLLRITQWTSKGTRNR